MSKEDETEIAYAVRRIRERALHQLVEFANESEPDVSACGPEHVIGFKAGHRQARREIMDEIDRLIDLT